MRAALVLLALAGCASVIGIPDETSVRAFAIEANVLGAHGATDKPLELVLESTGEEQTLPIADDGLLKFPRGLLDGSSFRVRGTPMCSIASPVTEIQGMDVRVEVRCDGLLALADFNFSAPMETTGAAPNYRSYGSVLIQHTALDPKAVYSDSGADGYKAGVGVDDRGVDILHNDSIEVRVTNPTAMLPMSMRSYFTTVDLSGPPAQFGYGKAPSTSGGGHYGTSIDTYVDVNVRYVLIGLPDAGNGRAVLYSRYGRVWTEVAAFDGVNPGGRFGAAVAIGKDTPAGTLVVAVGAPGEDKVYIYRKNGTSWDRTPHPGAGEYGTALAIDKSPTGVLLLIGAPSATAGVVANAGRVDTYNLQTMAPAAFYQATNPMPGARFGAAISMGMEGRLAAIGAPGELSSGDVAVPGYADAGAVYLIDTGGGAPKRITATTPGASDHFGAAVALSDDATVVAIGAPLEDSGSGTNESDNSKDAAGAVYVFSTSSLTGAYVKAPSIDVGDGFGYAVSLRGNATLGVLLAVGAPFEDSAQSGVDKPVDENAPDAGAAYVYSLQGTSATFEHSIKASNASAGDAFGMSVVLAAESLLVAAPYEDSDSTGWNGGQGDGDVDGDNGAVYAFR